MSRFAGGAGGDELCATLYAGGAEGDATCAALELWRCAVGV